MVTPLARRRRALGASSQPGPLRRARRRQPALSPNPTPSSWAAENATRPGRIRSFSNSRPGGADSLPVGPLSGSNYPQPAGRIRSHPSETEGGSVGAQPCRQLSGRTSRFSDWLLHAGRIRGYAGTQPWRTLR